MSGKYLFKLIIVGSSDSGKIKLIERYSGRYFKGGDKDPYGVDFCVTSCNTQYGQATLQIWDFGGEERFRTMRPAYCLGSSGGIAVFNLTKQRSFTEITEWLKLIRENTNNIPVILAGNKTDLIRNRCVNKQTILRVADELRMKYREFNTKTGENVGELFSEIATLMIEKNLRPIAPADTASEVATLQSLKKYLFKLIIVGRSGSGKTKLIQRYISGRFTTDETKMTQGVDFSVTSCNTQYGQATLQIWDFGGEERFRPMLPSFCHDASGGILIFDLTKQSSFNEVTEWFSLIRENTKKNIPIILAGNKSNLIQNRCISRQKIQKMTDKLRIKYVEFDLKTGENVVELFREITTLMIEKNLKPKAPVDTASKVATLQSLKQSAKLLQMEEERKRKQKKEKLLEMTKKTSAVELPIKPSPQPKVSMEINHESHEQSVLLKRMDVLTHTIENIALELAHAKKDLEELRISIQKQEKKTDI